MLWDKKMQLAREMKEAVDSESSQAEVHALRAEVHRMQVRNTLSNQIVISMHQCMQFSCLLKGIVWPHSYVGV